MVAKTKATKTMKDDRKKSVPFDELEEEKKYVCCDPDDQHFLEVIRKQDDRIIIRSRLTRKRSKNASRYRYEKPGGSAWSSHRTR